MEKPPTPGNKPGEEIKISPQELTQEARRAESYLSLLPGDIIRMVQEYTSITQAIQAIRESDYFKQLQKRITDLLTYPNHYWDQNVQKDREEIEAKITKIIRNLLIKYESQGFDEFMIALMLNVYPSFSMVFLSPPSYIKEKWAELNQLERQEILTKQYLDLPRVFSILKKYINESTSNYQSLIEYVKDFIANYERTQRDIYTYFKLTQYGRIKREAEERKIFIILLDMFENELKKRGQLPELKIILDAEQYYFIKELLCSSPSDLLKNPLLVRYLRNRNLSNTTSNALQFQQEFTHSWFDTFLKYLETNNVKAAWMFNTESIYNCPNALLRTLLIEKAGIKLFRYSETYPLFLYDSFDDNLYVDLLEYLFKHDKQATANLILNKRIKILIKSKLNVDPSYSIRQKEAKEYGMRLLIALIQSPVVDANFFKELLDCVSIFNSADSEGVTVLMHIIQSGRYDVANFLLQQPDININACDDNGHNALSFAQLFPESDQKETLIATLESMGVEEGTCIIQ